MARMARQTRLSGLSASVPSSSRRAGIGIGKQREAGNGQLGRPLGGAHRLVDRQPLDARHRGDRRADSLPSTRNSGQIRSSVVSTCSRTMRRAHSARRLRRGRIAQIERARAGCFGLAPARARLRSSGRPNLIAIERAPCARLAFTSVYPRPARHWPSAAIAAVFSRVDGLRAPLTRLWGVSNDSGNA